MDVITKTLIVIYKPALNLLPFFSIIFVKNTGAGFGILQGYNIILIVVSIMVLWFICKYYKKIPDEKYVIFASGLITAGIVGNLIDRIFRGYVIDFLDLFIKNYHWPTFNIADSALVIGVVLLIYYFSKKQ